MPKKGEPQKEIKEFRPITKPRYLPYAVTQNVWLNDLIHYNKHRRNVFYAKTKTDTKPPVMNPILYVDKMKMANDSRRLREIDMQNRQLVKTINTINRTKGRVDSFNPIAYEDCTHWRGHYLKMIAIEKENKTIYKRLMATESPYNKKFMEKEWKNNLDVLANSAKFPLILLQNKTIDQKIQEQPSISEGLAMENNVQRPKCFMDFKVKDGVHLGRIVIELYFDLVPVTVQNFLAICRGENGLSYVNCPVHKVVKGKYLETGDITNGNGKGGMSIYGKTFDEENFALKHSKAGVLSMIRVGPKVNNSQFSITFDKQEKLDNKRVVFGKIIRGNETICKIQDLGKKAPGPPFVPITIISCGEYIKGQVPPKPCYKFSSFHE